ncbi:MAG: Antibiotic biosynthesis monooxygenase [Actinomycetota bacterium]|jgi:quinol monooxygenase YgiN
MQISKESLAYCRGSGRGVVLFHRQQANVLGDVMAPRVMFATLKAQPGKRDELKAVFTEMFAVSESEPGTQAYNLIEGDDPDTLYFYEQYESQEAMDSHMAGAVLASIYPKMGEFLADGGAVSGTLVRGI